MRRREQQLIGEARDNLVEKAQQTAQELGEKAQTVAQGGQPASGPSFARGANSGQVSSG
jgi:hypothetical protein